MEINEVHRKIKALKACKMVMGGESLDELFELFATPQGVEFYKKTGFPNLTAWRANSDKARVHGIYVDAGLITLHDNERVVLVGDTHARLRFDDMADKAHRVIVLHGAQAEISASGYAVVFVDNISGKVATLIHDNAIIL